MNTTSAPRTSATITMSCPWCDAPLAVEDAFAAPALRCDACSTTIDFAPLEAKESGPLIAVAA